MKKKNCKVKRQELTYFETGILYISKNDNVFIAFVGTWDRFRRTQREERLSRRKERKGGGGNGANANDIKMCGHLLVS
jgi:hypothetical protein